MLYFSIAIRDCWASTVQNIRDADGNSVDDDSGATDFDATGANINGASSAHKTVKFYQNMCPVYAWANPIYGTSGNNPGEITPVGVTSSTEVSLRQFAFNDGLGTFSLGFFYHCQVIKISHLLCFELNVQSSSF